MDNIYDIIINDEIKEESQVFELLKNEVDKINELTDSIRYYLKHSRILFLLAFVFFFLGLNKFIWIGTFCFWFIVFLIASGKNSTRTSLKNRFQNLVLFFELKGLINSDNKDLLKDIKIKPLWFEG